MCSEDDKPNHRDPVGYYAALQSGEQLLPSCNTSAYALTEPRRLPIPYYLPDIILLTMFCHVFAGTSESEPGTVTGFCFWVDCVFFSI